MITSPKFDGFFQTFTSDYYTWSYLKDYTWGKMIGNYYYLNLRTVTVSGGTPYHSTKTLCFDFTRFPDLRLTQITNVGLNYGRDGPICVTQGNTDTRPFMVYYGQFHYTSDVYTYVYRSTLYSDDELNNYATLVNSPEVYVMTHRLTGGDPARLKRLKRLKYSLRNYDYLNKKLSLMILLNYDTNRGAPPDDLDAVNYYTGYSNGLLTPDFDAIKISGDGDYYQVFDAFPPTAVCYDYTIFVSSSTTYGADSDIQDIEIYGPWEMEFDYIE